MTDEWWCSRTDWSL